MSSARARWKTAERRIAATVGGTRLPVSGRTRGDQPDIAHPRLSIEVKNKTSLPAWLHDAMAQAIASRRDGQTPIVVLHQVGQRFDDAYVVVRLRDLNAGDMLGELIEGRSDA